MQHFLSKKEIPTYEGFVKRNKSEFGYQHLYRFDNGYGASIINGVWSYGLELEVIEWPAKDSDSWRVCYDTPITDDALGNLCDCQIPKILDFIKALPSIF